MTKNSNLQERIIEHSKEKFFTYGFKKITMDELAVDLQMSKKTIYKYFNSKQNLVEAVVEKQIVAVMSAYKEITEKVWTISSVYINCGNLLEKTMLFSVRHTGIIYVYIIMNCGNKSMMSAKQYSIIICRYFKKEYSYEWCGQIYIKR